ncbi:MAG: PilT/PilU family type 4a pilus ATPase [Deltaproteobacteria bacterium]|nr:PilT/PilU family type 4a pilus ATPase [Deltaproteobacteria bacterium]
MTSPKPKNIPAVPPKNMGGGQTLRMSSPIKSSSVLTLDEPDTELNFEEHDSLLTLDEPSETLDISDLDLDFNVGSFEVPKTLNPVEITSAPKSPPAFNKKESPSPAPSKTIEGMPVPVKKIPPKNLPVLQKEPSPLQNPPLKVKSSLLGHILVDNGLLTDSERDFVLKLQAQSGNFFKIGQLAIKQGFLSEENLERALLAQKTFVKKVHQEQSRMIRLPEEVIKAAANENTSLGSHGDDTQKGIIVNWLSSALKHGASDLHVMSGKPLVLRHLGKLIQSKQKPVDKESAISAFKELLTKDEIARFDKEKSVVKCFDIKSIGRARGNIFNHMDGVNGTFRLIPKTPPSLVSLNLPSALAKFTSYAQGLVLVTGPIGCGKTTTMAALIDIVNKERHSHIITVEKPVEFVHQNQKSLVTQREVGTHTNSFAAALRASLREDPDVIAVGEMNDIETARLTISAAETGHLVFATLHTDNAVRTINRALDIFPPDEQNQIRAMLSESLRGVICQRLVKREDEPGLIPVVEMLFTTPAMRNLIREQKVYQLPNAISMSRNMGNMTFADHAQELLENGQISEKVYNQFTEEEA